MGTGPRQPSQSAEQGLGTVWGFCSRPSQGLRVQGEVGGAAQGHHGRAGPGPSWGQRGRDRTWEGSASSLESAPLSGCSCNPLAALGRPGAGPLVMVCQPSRAAQAEKTPGRPAHSLPTGTLPFFRGGRALRQPHGKGPGQASSCSLRLGSSLVHRLREAGQLPSCWPALKMLQAGSLPSPFLAAAKHRFCFFLLKNS